jgi:hypothetical protein
LPVVAGGYLLAVVISLVAGFRLTRTFTIGAAASFGTRERGVQFVRWPRWM